MAGVTTSGQIAAGTQQALTDYLRRYAEPNRYDNYEFRQFGTEAIQPAGMGVNIFAPTFTKAVTSLRGSNQLGGVGEILHPDGSGARGMSFGNYQGQLGYYYDYFEISKVFAHTATLRGYLERGAEWLMKGVALTEEEIIQEWLFWDTFGSDLKAHDGSTVGGIPLDGDGATTTWGSVTQANLSVEAIAAARRELRNASNPGFSQLGGKFAALLSPNAVYQLLTNTSANSLRFEQESMNMTGAFRNNIVGTLFGCVIYETSHPVAFDASDTDNPFGAASVAGEIAVVFAPDAFYVASHETLNPQLYYKSFGDSPSPVNNYATLGVDFMTDAFGPTATTKMVVIPHTI